MISTQQEFSDLADRWMQIKSQDERAFLQSIVRRCEAAQAFAESQHPHISNPPQDEFSFNIGQIRKISMELRAECERRLSQGRPELADKSGIAELYSTLCGLIEDVCMLRDPEIIPVIEAAL